MKKMSVIRTFLSSINKEIRANKWSFVTYCVLRIMVILAMIRQIINQNYENVFLCALTLVLLLIPGILRSTFKLKFPTPLEITMLVFIFAAEILGELEAFYIKFHHWDTLLHTANGFLCAAAGFSLIDILNNSRKFHMNLSPLFAAIVAFCVSMTVGVIWEFFEFSADVILGTDMQKDTVITHFSSTYIDPTSSNTAIKIQDINDISVNGESLGINGYLDIGLIDTMEDLFVNFIGALVFSVAGYLYIKYRKKNPFIEGFIPVKKEDGNATLS